MKDYINSIDAVMNTLAALTITATEDNMMKLLACRQVLKTMKEKMEDADDNAE